LSPRADAGEDLLMIPPLRLSVGALLLVALPAAARAADAEAGEKRAERERVARLFEQIRVSADGVLGSGTSLVGVGSLGRYRRAGGALEFDVHRMIRGWLGFGLAVQVLPPAASGGAGRDMVFGRGEGFLDAAVTSWAGALPGSLVLGAGFGGDGPRYWFSDHGRFYGIGFARVRLFLTRDTRLQITYAAIPAALATQRVRLHEHRFEVATGWKLLQIGTRLTYTFTRGGDPARDFFQQELGAFVGLSVY
jgi:hypothetical protein